MFFKHHKTAFWVLSVAAVVCFAVGLQLGAFYHTYFDGALETTMTGTAFSETTLATEAEETEFPTTTEPVMETSEPSDASGRVEPGTANGLVLAAAVIFLAFGTVGALALCFFGRQEKPVLCVGLQLALGAAALYGMLAFSETGVLAFLFQLACAGVLLFALHEVISWLLHRCDLNWTLAGRIWEFCDVRTSLILCIALMLVLLVLGILVPVTAVFCGFIIFESVLVLLRQLNRLHRLLRELEPSAAQSIELAEKALGAQQLRQREAIQQAVVSERFKVDLISNVSHDLRTPLTSILGYSELLQKEQLSPEGAEQLQRLRQKSAYMRELVENLFELTKVSSGAIEGKRDSLDLVCLLEQTIGMQEERLQAADLTLRRHYPAEHLPICSDGMMLHQIFSNLLGNAVKYALPGTRVHLGIREENDIYVVRMTNVAAYEMDFSPEEIVQRFARGDRSRSTPGSGLGLAIAQTYAEAVGGSFRVEIDGDQFHAVVELPKN